MTIIATLHATLHLLYIAYPALVAAFISASSKLSNANHFHSLHKSYPDCLTVAGFETIKKNISGSDQLNLLLQRETFTFITCWL